MGSQLDILMYLQSIRNELLTGIFTFFTICTEVPVITVLTGVIYWCINKKAGQRTIFALCGSLNINAGVKNYIKMPRPIGTDGLQSLRIETATGYSFPSGHTQTSTTFWTSMMYLFRKSWIYIIGILMIIGAGISRLYLGVHWPMDVIVAWGFGIVLSIIFIKLFDYIDDSKNYYILVVLMLIFGVCTYFIGGEDLYKMFGLYTGFALGYMVEDTFINFSTENETRRKNIFAKNPSKKEGLGKKILRFVVGIISLLAVYLLLNYVQDTLIVNKTEEIINIIKYFKYTIVVFWGVAGAPALFKLFKLA
ncbi:MAG: phosphatase PAP2 family protein [Terrisporobacter othiniensis]|uniref:phosphatase PAP2 family protein n=1 Tax=Terrisporobacter petrolearius TaxID=1460447 RepID=UPI0022E8A09E|nr:phosphatase PAP2 family protein [Terrisporobacter petrolearius]MDU4860295.1 phosphatase PAP2 family protein [Terrisporobacter othiniensis]MDU6993476.1 phosphatase PAP2 family protein [Terrisporobacter othiniensis]